MNRSLTITGLIVLVLGKMAQSIGWQGDTVTEVQLESVMHAVGILMQIYGLLAAFYGRYRKGDIDLLGRRKLPAPTIDQLP